ncbi:MAG TPA: YidB family protein [Steroidobacteraceae bacterium]|nr:YidB family protein [Steroidobacteraceae bacterium]
MSILSNLESALGGMSNSPGTAGGSAAAGAVVVSQIISMIQSRPGGIGGLLQSFQQGGLGHVFQSWIASGPNLPVSADQLRNVLGSDWVSRITQATGLPQAQVEQHLSTLLPQIIDHLSPNGQMPQGDLGAALSGLAQRVLHG